MNKPKSILWAGAAAGTLDILAAITSFSYVFKRGTPQQLLQSVASGVFGKEAFTGGWATAFAGLFFHFIIATIWATIYFTIFPHLSFLKRNKWVSGILYGVIVWSCMNLIVLPLSNAGSPAFSLASVSRSMSIIIVFVGLPIAIIANNYYSENRH